jgi:hypothetical protein
VLMTRTLDVPKHAGPGSCEPETASPCLPAILLTARVGGSRRHKANIARTSLKPPELFALGMLKDRGFASTSRFYVATP